MSTIQIDVTDRATFDQIIDGYLIVGWLLKESIIVSGVHVSNILFMPGS